MKIATYLALIGGNGRAAKLAAEKQLKQKPPFQRSFGKTRRDNPQCKACRVTLNTNGNCYNRMCLAFEGNFERLERDIRLANAAADYPLNHGSQPAAQPSV